MSCDDCPGVHEFCVEQAGTRTYTATLLNQSGSPVPKSALTSLRMRILDSADELIASPTYINTRDAGVGTKGNVLDANGGTYHATSGLFTMVFEAGDFPIEDPTNRSEKKIIIVEATWTGGVKRWRLIATVENLNAVPVPS